MLKDSLVISIIIEHKQNLIFFSDLRDKREKNVLAVELSL